MPVRPHPDAGLQPERTVLAWGRTTVSFFVASAVFLRWLPHYGAGIVLLVGLAGLAALAIYATQRARYARHAAGIVAGRARADAAGVAWMAAAVVLLGAAALWLVASD